MAENAIEFKGGVIPAGGRGSLKFLLFLVGGGKEMSFYEAVKLGMVSRPQMDRFVDVNMDAYVTDFPIAKLFVSEKVNNGPMMTYSFYMMLGRNVDRQILEIAPRTKTGKAMGYRFKAEAKFLKESEALQLFSTDSLSYKMIKCQRLPPRDILREMITVVKPPAVRNAQRVRHLRIMSS